MKIEPVTLEGKHVRLEPMTTSHLDALMRAGEPDEIWSWMPWRPRTREEWQRWFDAAMREQAERRSLNFVTVDVASGEVAGATRYLAISPHDRRLEIGWTWINPKWQRTHINTKAKYLQLTHCFETLGCHRVELKTDSHNERSQRAIERIGGVREGVFRKHMLVRGGERRDTVWYSIIDDDWPAVKARLEAMLRR